jgi:hypothetical protein
MSFDKIQLIAINGIERASQFARFAMMECPKHEEFYNWKPSSSLRIESAPVSPERLPGWHKAYREWVLCNAVTEVVEKFYVFLEFAVVMLELSGQTVPFSSTKEFESRMKAETRKIRDEHDYFFKVKKYLNKLDICFNEDEEKIIWSFADIRNLITHNGGVAEERRNLKFDESDQMTLNWYRPEFFLTYESGRSVKVDEFPFTSEEAGHLGMRPKGLQSKAIKSNTQITFDYNDVQEICWTFRLLVHSISEKIISAAGENN